MPLQELDVSLGSAALPRDITVFLRDADSRISRFLRDRHLPGFVPCDFINAYRALRALAAAGVAPGNLFCEWGSGFGVVTCLAAMLDFDACGIEIAAELVEAARVLADDFGLAAEFFQGSFIPAGSEVCVAAGGDFAWLTTDVGNELEDMGLGPADFDVVFAYPWPDEEHVIGMLFERHAEAGALLLTYHEDGNCRLRRKVRARGAKPRRQRGESSERLT